MCKCFEIFFVCYHASFVHSGTSLARTTCKTNTMSKRNGHLHIGTLSVCVFVCVIVCVLHALVFVCVCVLKICLHAYICISSVYGSLCVQMHVYAIHASACAVLLPLYNCLCMMHAMYHNAIVQCML